MMNNEYDDESDEDNIINDLQNKMVMSPTEKKEEEVKESAVIAVIDGDEE